MLPTKISNIKRKQEISKNIMENTQRMPEKRMQFSLIDPKTKVLESSFKEKSGSKSSYVYWGPSNTFPLDLFNAYMASSTASSLINGTCEMMKTLKYQTSLDRDRINSYGDSLEDLIEGLSRDYMLYGCFGIQVIFNKINKIAEIVHLPMVFLRTNEDRNVFYFSKRFGKYTGKAVTYPAFEAGVVPERYSSVYFYTNSGHYQTYGISPQSSCLNDISAEALASEYIRENLENGLQSRYIISLPNAANLTDTQKAEIEEGIAEKFTGLGASPFMVYYSNGLDPVNLEKIDQDDTPELFNTIRQNARDNIFIANHATPNLFGDPDNTTGFSEQEYDEAFRLYKKMTLNPIMKSIERSINGIYGSAVFHFIDDTQNQTGQDNGTI